MAAVSGTMEAIAGHVTVAAVVHIQVLHLRSLLGKVHEVEVVVTVAVEGLVEEVVDITVEAMAEVIEVVVELRSEVTMTMEVVSITESIRSGIEMVEVTGMHMSVVEVHFVKFV